MVCEANHDCALVNCVISSRMFLNHVHTIPDSSWLILSASSDTEIIFHLENAFESWY